jgi:hypothetical protein
VRGAICGRWRAASLGATVRCRRGSLSHLQHNQLPPNNTEIRCAAVDLRSLSFSTIFVPEVKALEQ